MLELTCVAVHHSVIANICPVRRKHDRVFGECANKGGMKMNMNMILIAVLGTLFLGMLPLWPYSSNWGYLPSGGLGFLLLILVVLTLLGRLGPSAAEKP